MSALAMKKYDTMRGLFGLSQSLHDYVDTHPGFAVQEKDEGTPHEFGSGGTNCNVSIVIFADSPVLKVTRYEKYNTSADDYIDYLYDQWITYELLDAIAEPLYQALIDFAEQDK